MQNSTPLTPEQQQRLVDRWRMTFLRNVLPSTRKRKVLVGALVTDLFDSKKKRYLDFTAGGGVLPLAHQDLASRLAVDEIMQHFFQTGPFGEDIHGVQAEYIDKIIPYMPPSSRIAFTDSERTALISAVEMAQSALGMADAPLYLVNANDTGTGLPILSGLEEDSRKGVIILYPINPDTHEIVSTEVVERAARLRSKGWKVIWDQTVQGLGWTGQMFMVPTYIDYIVLGGALGGGVPLGAVVSGELQDVPSLRGRRNVLGGSGVGITAGMHLMKEVDRRLSDGSVRDLSGQLDVLMEGLEQMSEVETHGEGLLRGITLPTEEEAQRVLDHCESCGILLRLDPVGRRTIQIMCPMNMTRANVTELSLALEEALSS